METYRAQLWTNLVLSVITTVTMDTNWLARMLASVKSQVLGLVFNLFANLSNVDHLLRLRMALLHVLGTDYNTMTHTLWLI